MAIYHLHVSNIQRSKGDNAVKAICYRSCEKIYCEKSQETYDYTKKQDLLHKEIFLPLEAPKEFQDRAVLWNEVEKIEKRKDAQLAREIQIALPIEFSLKQNRELLKEYVTKNFVDKGMVADCAIHLPKDSQNVHAHVLLSLRDVNKEGFQKKNRPKKSRYQD